MPRTPASARPRPGSFEQDGQIHPGGLLHGDTAIPEAELLSYAASYLPRYMVPAVILRLDALPLSPNGKIDESRLPLPRCGSGPQPSGRRAPCSMPSWPSPRGAAPGPHGGVRLLLPVRRRFPNAMEVIGLVSGGWAFPADRRPLCLPERAALAELLGDEAPRAENRAPTRPGAGAGALSAHAIQQGIYVQSLWIPAA